jgi:hypothetical protein
MLVQLRPWRLPTNRMSRGRTRRLRSTEVVAAVADVHGGVASAAASAGGEMIPRPVWPNREDLRTQALSRPPLRLHRLGYEAAHCALTNGGVDAEPGNAGTELRLPN